MKNHIYLFQSLLLMGILLGSGNLVGQVRELPDNIQNANCTFAPEATQWGIVEDWSSTESTSTLVIPLVGDINGDGIPEIVCFAPLGDDYYNVNTVQVFNSQSHELIYTFTLPGNVSTVDAAPYGMVKLPSGHVVFAACTQNNNMYGFDLTAHGTTPLWTTPTGFPAPNVGFADFNGDGYPEIYVGNKIFDAETGTLLVTDPSVTNFGGSYAHTGNHKLPSPCVANLTGDAKPELVLGNEVYEIVITNRNGTAGNSMTLSASITPPAGIAADGHPQVVDFNLDGYLDVFISNKNTSGGEMGMYVWDVHNNAVLGSITVAQTGSGKSIPLIADIDGDNNIELVIQSRVSGNKVQAYKFNRNTNTFSLMWDIAVDEDSYSNGATTFDFNSDGEMEVLLSDQSTIKILEGTTGSLLTQLSFGECTVMQYPIIADVDADGSAEIAICGQFGAGHTNSGHLVVFCSSTVPWASARKVWNQYMYNVTNVNEDLSVMHTLYNNATAFTDPQGIVRRPFNNFLQQATTIDQYGRPFYAVPDLMAINASVAHDGDEVVIDFSYTNQGDNILAAPYYITVFANMVGGTVLFTQTMDAPLRQGYTAHAILHLQASQLCNMQNLNNLVLAVNCNGGGIAQNGNLQPECDITNNTLILPYTGHSSTNEIYEEACGEFVWNGQSYTQSGNYPQTFTNIYGCDSLVTLHLTIMEAIYNEWSYATCGNYSWNGVTYNQSGNYTQNFVSTQGCDSIVTLHLTIFESYHTDWSYETCGSYSWNGITYNQSGNYTQNLTSIHGCDSIVTLHLTINEGYQTEWSHQACESYTWNGTTYSESGDYEQQFTSIQGCDSIVTLHLTIDDVIETEWSYHVCNSFVWNGQTYTESGDYEQQFTSIQGCDSIVTLHLTIDDAIETEWSYQSCESYSWNGQTYTETGDYEQQFTSIQGCDSIVVLHFTLNDAFETEWSHQSCESFTWNGQTYTESGDYMQQFTSQLGCDSLVTLHLSIADVIKTEWEAQACSSFVWNQQVYEATGEYTQIFSSTQGCDSISILHLTLTGQYETEMDTVHCGSYLFAGQEFAESGNYDVMLESVEGCDSLVHLHLTLKPLPVFNSAIIGDQHVFVATNFVSGRYRYSVAPVEGASRYEWLVEGPEWTILSQDGPNCELQVLMPGVGKLVVRAWNDCGFVEQSLEIQAGFFGVDDNETVTVKVYPNPTKDKVFVEAEAIEIIRVFSPLGQLLDVIETQGEERIELDLHNYASGLYSLEVLTKYGVTNTKLNLVR